MANLTLEELDGLLEEEGKSSVFEQLSNDDEKVDSFWNGAPVKIETSQGIFTVQIQVTHDA